MCRLARQILGPPDSPSASLTGVARHPTSTCEVPEKAVTCLSYKVHVERQTAPLSWMVESENLQASGVIHGLRDVEPVACVA